MRSLASRAASTRSQYHEQIQPQRHEDAEKPLLLGKHREDEIVVGNGQEIVLPLRALHEPFAVRPPIHGDPRLPLLIAVALGIQLRIDERRDPRLLIVLEREPPGDRRHEDAAMARMAMSFRRSPAR